MPNDSKKLNFEQSLEKLDSVVRELESADTGLDRSLALYEQGVSLLKRCQSILDQAERKIRLLTGIDAEGNVTTEEFDATSTAERAAGARVEQATSKERKNSRRSARQESEDAATEDLLF